MSYFLEVFLKYRRLQSLWRSRPVLKSREIKKLRSDSRIAVVGAGVASVTYVEEMARRGFKNITLIVPDEQWGGKCVHQGCMPFEYFWHKGRDPRKFSQNLGQQIEAKIKNLGVRIIHGEALSTQDERLLLRDGSQIDFDFLALGIGSQAMSPSNFPNSIRLEEIWEKDFANKKVVLFSDGSDTSWSVAATLRQKGADVLLLQTGAPSMLQKTASFQYFQSCIVNEGVVAAKLHKVVSLSETTIEVSTDQGFFSGPYDFILEWKSAGPKSFNVNGKSRSLEQAFLSREAFYLEKNILLLGETSAAVSAAEAETYSIAVSLSEDSSESSGDVAWYQQPIRIHAAQSWAYCGPQEDIFADCLMLDFAEIGWSHIDKEPGRLWYRFDRQQGRVTSIHIVHKDAGSLINIANMLLQFPVKSPSWLSGFVHPSGAEIFKKLAVKILGEHHGDF